MTDATAIDGSYTALRAAAVTGVELDGEAVLYHLELRTVCVLNPTATIVWNFLDGSSDLETLAADLAEVFATDLDTVRNDVLDTVREFGRQGLLDGIDPDPDVIAAHALEELDGDEVDG
jgi:hypothetical protein